MCRCAEGEHLGWRGRKQEISPRGWSLPAPEGSVAPRTRGAGRAAGLRCWARGSGDTAGGSSRKAPARLQPNGLAQGEGDSPGDAAAGATGKLKPSSQLSGRRRAGKGGGALPARPAYCPGSAPRRHPPPAAHAPAPAPERYLQPGGARAASPRRGRNSAARRAREPGLAAGGGGGCSGKPPSPAIGSRPAPRRGRPCPLAAAALT